MKSASRFLRLICVFASAVILSGCQTNPKPDWELPPGVKTLTVNGYPMAYIERGSGPTVVLVHGALNDYRTWTLQMEPLSSRFRVVSVSLRHYYPEPWKGDGEFSLKLHADDVAAFIERLGVGPVFLVGWSRGGPVAAGTTRSRPDLVRKLVLMDPGLYALVPSPSGTPTVDRRPVVRARGAEAYFKKGEMEAGLEYYFDDVNGAGAWKRLPEEQRKIRLQNAWTVVGSLADVESVTCQDVGRFTMPVLLMSAERSPPQYAPILDAFQRCQPAATRVTVPKAAHQMHQMNPPAFNAALLKFLSE